MNILLHSQGDAHRLDHILKGIYLADMATLHCTRCGQDRDRMAFQPFQNDLGRRAFDEICSTCWAEWLKMQQQLINHYGLNLREPKAKEFLFQNMEQFLFTAQKR